MSVIRSSATALSCAMALTFATAQAQQDVAPATSQANPYAPYEGLIGEWDTGEGGAIVQRFRWGPGRAYVLYSTSNVAANGAEHVHFEGIFLYNAAHGDMDFLFALEPGSLAQEHGTLHVAQDGSIVRDVTLVGADGQTGQFRQTFRMMGRDVAKTSLLRQTADGAWTPTFPGSEHLTMRRRAP